MTITWIVLLYLW